MTWQKARSFSCGVRFPGKCRNRRIRFPGDNHPSGAYISGDSTPERQLFPRLEGIRGRRGEQYIPGQLPDAGGLPGGREPYHPVCLSTSLQWYINSIFINKR